MRAPFMNMLKNLRSISLTLAACALLNISQAADAKGHPDSKDWPNLFKADLSDAKFPEGVWTVEGDAITASKDEAIWTAKDYENFVLDFEVKNGPAANSGIVVYCTDTKNWIPNSVEIQIADDHADQWAKADRTWQCAAIFGRQAAYKSAVKKAGEWNRMTVKCEGQKITVWLNGQKVNECDMSRFTDAKKNPDGSPVPPWLSKPMATMPTKGKIGLQGKHGGAPIWFRNVKIQELSK